jgi:hypothetical protein
MFRTFKKIFSFSPFLYLPTLDLDVDPKDRKNLITKFIKITGGSEEVELEALQERGSDVGRG